MATEDHDRRELFRAGGICAVALGVSYLIITGLYVMAGAPPTGPQAWLEYLSDQTTTWWGIAGLSVLTDVLFLPIALALYVALASLDRRAMLVGAGLLVLFALLDLAVTWPNFAALITLADGYAAATDADRTARDAAAGYPSAVLASRLFGVYVIVVPALGIAAMALAMLRERAWRATAYVGLARRPARRGHGGRRLVRERLGDRCRPDLGAHDRLGLPGWLPAPASAVGRGLTDPGRNVTTPTCPCVGVVRCRAVREEDSISLGQRKRGFGVLGMPIEHGPTVTIRRERRLSMRSTLR